MFMCNFGHVYSFVKCKIFKQYCCSFDGAPLWILDSNSIRELHVAYGKSFKTDMVSAIYYSYKNSIILV